MSGRPLRPAPAGHTWAWIVLTIGVVIFMTITLWVVSDARTSKDPKVDLSGDWRMRWANVPGPAEAYERQAYEAMMEDRRDDAAVWLSKSLALDPERLEVWSAMTCLSVVHQHPYTLDERGVERMVAGPLVEYQPLMDWKGMQSLLTDHPDRVFAWVTHCAGLVSPVLNAETTTKTLDTAGVSP